MGDQEGEQVSLPRVGCISVFINECVAAIISHSDDIAGRVAHFVTHRNERGWLCDNRNCCGRIWLLRPTEDQDTLRVRERLLMSSGMFAVRRIGHVGRWNGRWSGEDSEIVQRNPTLSFFGTNRSEPPQRLSGLRLNAVAERIQEQQPVAPAVSNIFPPDDYRYMF